MSVDVKLKNPAGLTYAVIETTAKSGDTITIADFKKISQAMGIRLEDGAKVDVTPTAGAPENDITIGDATPIGGNPATFTTAARIAIVVWGMI